MLKSVKLVKLADKYKMFLFTGNILTHISNCFKACKRFLGQISRWNVWSETQRSQVDSVVPFLTWINPDYVETTWRTFFGYLTKHFYFRVFYHSFISYHQLFYFFYPQSYWPFVKSFKKCHIEHTENCWDTLPLQFMFISLDRGPCLLEQWMRTHTEHNGLLSFKIIGIYADATDSVLLKTLDYY